MRPLAVTHSFAVLTFPVFVLRLKMNAEEARVPRFNPNAEQ